MTPQQKLDYLRTATPIEIIKAMGKWGYIVIKESLASRPETNDQPPGDEWWAGFGWEPTRTLFMEWADTPEEAVKQAAIKAIQQEIDDPQRTTQACN